VLGLLLPAGIAVAALDFSGSGLSEGGHVTLGYREAEDLADLVAALVQERGPKCRIAIWGRSMGAVAALLAASAEAKEAVAFASSSSKSTSSTSSTSTSTSSAPSSSKAPPPATKIAAVVLDSPFSSLPELMAELVAKQKLLPFPKALLSSKGLLLSLMARSVRKRACFDLREVVPLRAVSGGDLPSSSSSSSSSASSSGGRTKSAEGGTSSSSNSGSSPETSLFASLLPPALFGHAQEDTFISSHHSRRLHSAYLGSEKALCAFGGDHNSARPASFRSAALGFLKEVLFGSEKRAMTTTNDDVEGEQQLTSTTNNLSSFASLGAATAFDTALSEAARDHHAFGAVAAGHAADERESWGRAASAAFASTSASSLFLPGGARNDTDEEELLEMERAIAASLDLSCAAAEQEAKEAKEAALAAAAAAAAAAEQLQRENEQRRQKEREAAAITHRSSFAPPAAAMETATTMMASFDLTEDQRELHAFFSPPSPKAEQRPLARSNSSGRQEQKPPVVAAASKRQLTLPKAPPMVSPSAAGVASAALRKNASVEARAGGWRS
jgi:pimeloyl-ACP methyl ester carboxylesterase